MAHATTRLRTCYLVRHAIAERRGPAWPDDGQRPLTPEGVARMRQVARGLVAYGVTLDRIVTSPLVRARQTADLIAGAFDDRQRRLTRGAIVLPELAPDTAPDVTMRALAAAVPDESAVALVGHEPDLGVLAAWLIGAERPLAFKKGGVCRIDVRRWPARGGAGELLWFAPPKLLRLAGK